MREQVRLVAVQQRVSEAKEAEEVSWSLTRYCRIEVTAYFSPDIIKGQV